MSAEQVGEGWSWKKFVLGIFDGKNYAKSIIFMACSAIIIVICYSTFTVIKARFVKVTPTQTVGENSGTIITENTDKQGNTWSLFNLINFR
jgi:hypothetical protein